MKPMRDREWVYQRSDNEDQRGAVVDFSKWFDALESRDTPFTKIMREPVWMSKTRTVVIDEAKHAFYLRLNEILYPINQRLYDDDDDMYYREPSPELKALNQLRDELHAESVGQVPNPDYDPERAQAQTKHEWGQAWIGTAGMLD